MKEAIGAVVSHRVITHVLDVTYICDRQNKIYVYIRIPKNICNFTFITRLIRTFKNFYSTFSISCLTSYLKPQKKDRHVSCVIGSAKVSSALHPFLLKQSMKFIKQSFRIITARHNSVSLPHLKILKFISKVNFWSVFKNKN